MNASKERTAREERDGAGEPASVLDLEIEVELGDGSPLAAARERRRGGDEFGAYRELLRVPADDADYRAAAAEAVELAQRLNVLDFELEDFLRPYLAVRARAPRDLDVLERLADLYETNGFHELAAGLCRRVVEVDPRHPARERLARVEAFTAANPTVELVVQTVDRQRVRQLMHRDGRGSGAFGDLAPGMVLGERYFLEAEIGRGSTAVVFSATDRETGRAVAIKVFLLDHGDASLMERFKREVDLARRLVHPHIAALYDIRFTGAYTFIVMELLVGQNLDALVESGPLPIDRATGILLQAAAGLGYAHGRGVIHRDVKSENLFLTDQGEVKVMDFGMAKVLDARSITANGFMGGTPLYIAPEQIGDFRHVTHRADLYSLGVVAYELFTGTLPFTATSLVGLLQQHMGTPPVDPREHRPELPEGVARLILDLLAKRPDERPRDCAEVRARLLLALEGSSGASG